MGRPLPWRLSLRVAAFCVTRLQLPASWLLCVSISLSTMQAIKGQSQLEEVGRGEMVDAETASASDGEEETDDEGRELPSEGLWEMEGGERVMGGRTRGGRGRVCFW